MLCAFFMDEKKIRNRERGTAAPPGANQRGWNRHPGVSLILYQAYYMYSAAEIASEKEIDGQ